ncbi:MAG: hypothetical protein K2J40_02720 [Ruminococcus sp.]|nr:hypothetical protein [Ruminococcus sp.]
MAGRLCPKCGNYTFFETTTGRKCTKCNYAIFVPPNNGKGGRGKRCPNCRLMTMFDGKCTRCGAKEI